MKNHKTLDLAAHPWQLALLEPFVKPLEAGDAVCYTLEGDLRRLLPHEFADGFVVDPERQSIAWPDQRWYTLLTPLGLDLQLGISRKNAIEFFSKVFSEEKA